MSESLPFLVETAERLFADLAANPAAPFADAWSALEEAGFPSLLVPEDLGGFGGDWRDAFAVLRLAGFNALPAPLAEAVIAAAAAAAPGLPAVDGLVTVAERMAGEVVEGCFTGQLSGVAHGRDAAFVVAQASEGLIRLKVADAASVEQRLNPADEPRDLLRFEAAPVETGGPVELTAMAALARTAQIAGALDAALAIAITHANERVQFGKPIGKFQAVQQALAVFAEEAAAANSAGQAAASAADRFGSPGEAAFEVACAKLRAGMAAETGASVAHQTLGAIGFTREHALQRFTRRLVSWRTEFGADRYWAERLGRQVAQTGANGFWPMICARSDAA